METQQSATLVVYKLDDNAREIWSYPATVLQRGDTCIQLEAHFNRDDTDLGFVTFERGDRFMEYFYSDRWYNIFAVYNAVGSVFRGWYCNICRPATITASAVRCEDLALDLWVTPDGATLVLDEDEFASLTLPLGERQAARSALARLLRIAKRGALPR